MPAIPAALRELAETAPLYVETATSREVRWSPETGPLGKLPGPRKGTKTAKPAPVAPVDDSGKGSTDDV